MPEAPLIKFPRAEVSELIKELTNVPVIWDNEPQPFVGQVNGKPGYWVELMMIATATKGIDDFRPDFDPVNQINKITQVSYRIDTVQVRVQSFAKDVPAFDVIDQIRRGLRSITARGRYVEVNIAFVDWSASRDTHVDKDNRTASESSFDVRIAWQVSAAPGDEDGGWIKEVAEIEDKLTP